MQKMNFSMNFVFNCKKCLFFVFLQWVSIAILGMLLLGILLSDSHKLNNSKSSNPSIVAIHSIARGFCTFGKMFLFLIFVISLLSYPGNTTAWYYNIIVLSNSITLSNCKSTTVSIIAASFAKMYCELYRHTKSSPLQIGFLGWQFWMNFHLVSFLMLKTMK